MEDQKKATYGDIIKDALTKGNADGSVLLADSIIKLAVGIINKDRDTIEKRVDDVLGPLKQRVLDLKHPREFDVEEKRIALEERKAILEDSRERLKMELEENARIENAQIQRARAYVEIYEKAFNLHVDACTGFWGIAGKGTKNEALLRTQLMLGQIMGPRGADGSATPQLPQSAVAGLPPPKPQTNPNDSERNSEEKVGRILGAVLKDLGL
jgi:hypothetical protein